MAIINDGNAELVRTAFSSAAQDVLSSGVPGQWNQFTTDEEQTGLTAELTVYDGLPRTREWVGEKQMKQLKKFKRQDSLRKWESSIRLDVDEINQDPHGLISRMIGQFRESVASFYDEIMVDKLFENLPGYDGSALAAADHSRMGGASDQSNISSAVLSLAELENAKQYFRTVTNQRGKKLGCQLTHVLVGPNQETKAQQITGSDQLVGISATGEYITPGSGTAVDAGLMKNYIGGNAVVIVSPEIDDNSWAAFDLSKGRSKPLYQAVFSKVDLTIKDDPKDDNVFFDDEVLISLVGKMTPMAMNYQTIYMAVSP